STELVEGGGDEPGLLRLLRSQPNPWIVGHVLAALAAYCWFRFPIFGRPKTIESHEPRRFGRHVESLGDLLARTGNLSFAIERLGKFQTRTKSSRTSTEST